MKVTIYGAEWCAYCKAAKQYLTSKNIAFDYVDIEKNEEARIRITAKANATSIPIIVIGDELLVGFDRQKINETLARD